uniref:Glycine N-acyltransferase-like protein n=1 Tax=Heterorhabditis bacteriophora TaxID=37862 RepID=A0A1I7XVM7_HETBA
MIMLKEYFSHQDLQEALDVSQVIPELLFIHHSINNYLLMMYPCREIRVYSYPFNNPTYWFLVDLKKNACSSYYLFSLYETNFTAARSKELLDGNCNSFLISTLLSQYFDEYEMGSRVEHNFFYMTPTQMKNTQKVEIVLPYGYELSELTTKDAETVLSTAQNDESLELIRDRIQFLPSSCIRQSSSCEIVSHELSSNMGNMTELYTVPDHRRQGLGSAAEINLAQKMIDHGQIPFKTVPTHLTSILLSSEESPFWTMWTRNTLPVMFVNQMIEKRQ